MTSPPLNAPSKPSYWFDMSTQHVSLVSSTYALCFFFIGDVGALSANRVPRLDSPALHAPGALPLPPSPRVPPPAATPAPHKRADRLRVRNEMRFYPLRHGVVLLALVCIVSLSWIKSIPGDGGKVIYLFVCLLIFQPLLSAQKHTHTYTHTH